MKSRFKEDLEREKIDSAIASAHFCYALHIAQDMKGIENRITHHMREEPTLQKLLHEHVIEIIRLLHFRYPELKLENYI